MRRREPPLPNKMRSYIYDAKIIKISCHRLTVNMISFYGEESLKAHTDRTRFGNATRILDFQCRLALVFFHFSQTFGNVLAI